MKSIIKILLMVMAALSWQSCTDLEEEILDNVIAVPTTGGGDGGGSGGGGLNIGAPYNALFNGTGNHNSYFSVQEVSTDEVVVPQRGGDWFDGGQWIRMHRHEFTSEEQSFNNSWNDTYGGIFECNSFLGNGDVQADPSLVAEVRTLRAYYYFRLLDLFGNIRITTEDGVVSEQATREEAFTFIENEVLESLDNLSPSNDASTYGRMNKWAGHALLAKLYLNAEVYIGTPRWQETIDQANEVINSGLYSLSANYSDVFSPTNTQNIEHIFVVPFDQSTGVNFNLVQMTLSYVNQNTFRTQEQPWNGYATLEEFYNSYEDGDARKENNFVEGLQRDINGSVLVDLGFENGRNGGPADPDGAPVNFTPNINELEPNALRQAGARLGKFDFEIGTTANMNNDYPIFRLGDILLTKAEAIARLNSNWSNGETLMLVNMLRERAEVAPYSTLDANEFLAERGREVFIESWRRQDLIRFDQWGAAWWEKPAHNDEFREIYPIPQAQINSNASLRQNPGY